MRPAPYWVITLWAVVIPYCIINQKNAVHIHISLRLRMHVSIPQFSNLYLIDHKTASFFLLHFQIWGMLLFSEIWSFQRFLFCIIVCLKTVGVGAISPTCWRDDTRQKCIFSEVVSRTLIILKQALFINAAKIVKSDFYVTPGPWFQRAPSQVSHVNVLRSLNLD